MTGWERVGRWTVAIVCSAAFMIGLRVFERAVGDWWSTTVYGNLIGFYFAALMHRLIVAATTTDEPSAADRGLDA